MRGWLRSILIGDPFKSVFSQLVAVEFRIEQSDLVNGSVERCAIMHHSREHIVYRLNVLFGQPITVEDEGRVAIEDGLADFLLTVSVIRSVFGHSNPPI